MTTEAKVAQQLIANHQTLATAESCSGGLLASRLTDIPGSSRFFRLGIVSYSNEAKEKSLKIPPATLQRYGAVSEETAVAMAQGVRKIHQTDFGMSITGIAGPEGGSKTKPVGLTYIAVATCNETLCLKCLFSGSRGSIKRQATTQALKTLYEFLA